MFRITLLLSLAASVSAKTTLRRLMSGNSDAMSSALAAGGADEDDYTCTMFFPEDAKSCESLVDGDGNPCVWCPVGDIFGACVSGEQAMAVNEAEVPHITCGAEPDTSDIEFWGTLEQCDIGGDTEKDCLETGPCTWCKIDQEVMGIPKFGLCLSTEYHTTLTGLDDSGMLNMLMQCTTDSTDTSLQVGSLTDMKCILEGNPDPDDSMPEETAALCGRALDAEGRTCQVVPVMGFMDFCMSETQAGLFNLLMQQADDMGVFDELGDLDGADTMGFGDEPMYDTPFDEDEELPMVMSPAGSPAAYYTSYAQEEEPYTATTTSSNQNSGVYDYSQEEAPEVDNEEPTSASELLAKYVQKEELEDEEDSEIGN